MKSKNTKSLKQIKIVKVVVVILVFLVGIAGGLLLNRWYDYGDPQPIQLLASNSVITTNKQQFINQYFKQLTSCGTTDNVSPATRVSEFYQYLKINGYGNRVVARSCNDIDSLYFRVNNSWQQGFTIGLNFTQYYKWQQECEIQDITNVSYTEQWQNESLDQTNYSYCKYVLMHNSLPSFSQL